MSLSDELRRKLSALRSSVEFDPAQECFIDSVTKKRKRGLTKILSQLVPVPRDTLDDEDEAFAAVSSKKPRKSQKDPEANPTVLCYSGATMARCGGCDGAIAWMRANGKLVQRLAAVKSSDAAHGIVVDYQISVYTRLGMRGLFKKCAVVDPCVGTLLEHFASQRLAVVASQVPIYCEEMDVATAIDVVLTDIETRTQVILGEVKSTQTTDVERNNRQYERLRGRLQRTTLRGLPLSYVMRHKLQLFCMKHMVRLQHKFDFDDAFILRVSPGVVRKYELNDYYEERAAKVVRAIALKTGKKKTRVKKYSPYC